MDRTSPTLVAIATYNEIENLPPLVTAVFSQAEAHGCPVDLLVVDDNSPDGTGRWASEQAARDARLRCLLRPGKLGLGTATIAAIEYAIAHGYQWLLTMDADFSHHPRYLPAMLAVMTDRPEVDVVIGSRYVSGGGVQGWPWQRRWMSRCVNLYARCLLGLPVKDCSGAFRLIRVDRLRQVPRRQLRSRGYSLLEELLWHLKQQGAVFREIPIVFMERAAGQSKINAREALAALWVIFRLGVTNWLGW